MQSTSPKSQIGLSSRCQRPRKLTRIELPAPPQMVPLDDAAVNYNNHGARELEQGNLLEARKHLLKATQSFGADIENGAAVALKRALKHMVESLGKQVVTTLPTTAADIASKRTLMWCNSESSFTCPSTCNVNDLHIRTQAAIILPSDSPKDDHDDDHQIDSVACMLYNFGLCHHLLALQGVPSNNQDSWQIALTCYSNVTGLLKRCNLHQRDLNISTYNNMGCVLDYLGQTSRATTCFRSMLYEITLMELSGADMFNTIFDEQDASGLVLNTLYESTAAVAA